MEIKESYDKSFFAKEMFYRDIESLDVTTTTSHTPLIRILILGGGFAGVQVLKKLQAEYRNDADIEITLVSKDNYFLFTPMLPDVVSGTIEPIHIATPIRALCNKRTKFYEAGIVSIELQNKQVVIIHSVNDNNKIVQTNWQQIQGSNICYHILKYDYLVLAVGNETNFFGNPNIANNAFTIKTLHDAIILRDHIINMLEQADLEYQNEERLKRLMTFVVVGGGFAGVETIGEINSFIHNSISNFYHNVKTKYVRVILVDAHKSILPEVTEDLSEFALRQLRKKGVEVMLNRRVIDVDADMNSVKLDNGSIISSNTLIWAGGVRPCKIITDLTFCEHDKTGRIIVNDYLEVIGHTGVFAVGDCAFILDHNTGKACPPTAQHAIRQGKVVAKNIISEIKRMRKCKNGKEDNNSKTKFNYRTKGVMAKIGDRSGVGILLGYKVHGFSAWLLWHIYYLANLPSLEKKYRVAIDWITDILFKKNDITRLKTYAEIKTGSHIVDEIQLSHNQRRSKNLHTI